MYLGGLGRDDAELSEHLSSRHDVGAVLADGPVPVTELRAAVIIGSGSASFEMLRHLTDVLPVDGDAALGAHPLPTDRDPRRARLPRRRARRTPTRTGRVLEIGGPDVVTYEEMMQIYADVAGLRPRVVRAGAGADAALSSYWVGLVTPLPVGLARPLSTAS